MPVIIPAKWNYNAKYLKNYDGDTISFNLDLGFSIKFDMRVRLKGVDTPEMNSKDEAERVKAKEARDFVHDQLSRAEEITIHTDRTSTGKTVSTFNRYVADVYYTLEGVQTFLADELINRGLAVKY